MAAGRRSRFTLYHVEPAAVLDAGCLMSLQTVSAKSRTTTPAGGPVPSPQPSHGLLVSIRRGRREHCAPEWGAFWVPLPEHPHLELRSVDVEPKVATVGSTRTRSRRACRGTG